MRTNTLVVGPRSALATRTVRVRGRVHVPVERASAKLRYRSPAAHASVERTEDGFRLVLDEPADAVAVGQTAVLYEGDAVVGAGRIVEDRLTRIAHVTLLASTARDVARYALAAFLLLCGLGLAYMLFQLGGTFSRLSSFIRGTERELLPVITKTGGTVDRVNPSWTRWIW